MKIFLNFILLVFSTVLFSQELNLFQETDKDRSDQSRTPDRGTNQQGSIDPEFRLMGTSRFGEKYIVSLITKNKEKVNIEWLPGKILPIEGFKDFALANVSSRKATIRYPSSVICESNKEIGLSCNGSMAILTLNNAKPIENIESLSGKNIDDNFDITDEELSLRENDVDTLPGTNILRRNPFSGELQTLPDLTPEEIASREQRRAERAEQFRNFEIIRIADEDIPTGMRRIRTPFGDSLEPIDE